MNKTRRNDKPKKKGGRRKRNFTRQKHQRTPTVKMKRK
jgi:hypothetical protein